MFILILAYKPKSKSSSETFELCCKLHLYFWELINMGCDLRHCVFCRLVVNERGVSPAAVHCWKAAVKTSLKRSSSQSIFTNHHQAFFASQMHKNTKVKDIGWSLRWNLTWHKTWRQLKVALDQFSHVWLGVQQELWVCDTVSKYKFVLFNKMSLSCSETSISALFVAFQRSSLSPVWFQPIMMERAPGKWDPLLAVSS